MARYRSGPAQGGRRTDTFHPSKERQERKVAAKEAKAAPPDTTKPRGKNSRASCGPSAEGFTKGMKKPKGGGK